MTFLLFVGAFVGCACVLVPLVAYAICAATDRWDRPRRGHRARDYRCG
jgi:hypothetical protein